MKQLFKTLFSLIILLQVTCCLNSSDSSTKTLDLKNDFNTITINNEYQLSLPNYMKKSNNLNEDASLQYQNIFKEVYAVVIDEPMDEFVEAFKELGEYDDTISELENYKNVQENYFEEAVDVDHKYVSRSLTVNGISSEIISFDGAIDNVNIAYTLAFYSEKGKVYMLMLWTLKNRRNKYQETFNQVINSFNMVKAKSKKNKAA